MREFLFIANDVTWFPEAFRGFTPVDVFRNLKGSRIGHHQVAGQRRLGVFVPLEGTTEQLLKGFIGLDGVDRASLDIAALNGRL